MVTGVPMLVFMAANFVKARSARYHHHESDQGKTEITVFGLQQCFADRGNAYRRRNHQSVIPNVAGILLEKKDYVGIACHQPMQKC